MLGIKIIHQGDNVTILIWNDVSARGQRQTIKSRQHNCQNLRQILFTTIRCTEVKIENVTPTVIYAIGPHMQLTSFIYKYLVINKASWLEKNVSEWTYVHV